jgi:PAS domain-containing protein
MRPALESTQLLPRLLWQNPRIHLLDDSWLLTIATLLLALGLPWFAGHLAISIGPATAGLLVLGALHVALTLLASMPPSPSPWRRRSLEILHAVGICALGFIWWQAGALQNPALLLAFVLPVLGSIFVSRFYPYVSALIALIVVGIVTLVESPDLRWYAGGLLGHGTSVLERLGTADARTHTPFAGFYAPTGYQLMLIETFAIVLLCSALAAEYLGTIFERLIGYTLMARAEAQRGQELWVSLIEQAPLALLLIDPESLRVVAASASAARLLGQPADAVPQAALLELADFAYPDLIEELIATGDAAGPTLTPVRLGGGLRLLEVGLATVTHLRQRLILVTLVDASERHFARAALDATEAAVLVIDARGRVRAWNRAAGELFGALSTDADARSLLHGTAERVPWWHAGIHGRRKTHAEIGGRIVEVSAHAVAAPTEGESLVVCALTPVSRADLAAPNAPADVAWRGAPRASR